MSTLPAWARRLLAKELRFVADGMEFDREAAQKILAFLSPRKKNEKQKATEKQKLQGAAARRAGSADIRGEVFKRAGWRCELNDEGRCQNDATELDHWLSGSGRRRQKQSVETTWALCRVHHFRRTHNYPDAAYWNARFAEHCSRHGYPAPAHVEHAQLPGRAAR